MVPTQTFSLASIVNNMILLMHRKILNKTPLLVEATHHNLEAKFSHIL